MEKVGKSLMLLGLIVLVLGGVVWLLGDKVKWLGRLPGDIRVEKDNFRFYMPFTTMIIISAVLTLILWVIRSINK